ncbi:RusA family crossover junction endodeoxyribonuclease [Brevibacillus laterosporus]|uniref:RusA family crossover junction endodeoxyribonuclease n=1 Tax=Brevibacillus laterosporus TaxID=1465 RepID=A0AAP3GCK3_BRELA|nr:RusA family crossover junction endodeoxyribonuclease [Brevibacillus laterosporus]MCR8981615.1 RusA family crossover junction endodeoxyribonuclease [Brevibacillus laterosporus]MCZ0808770.1 RusA family crossover junction endodeoxyribonuclease [Brevibacillus laterosporus]MCZ0827257.1 RusA family crossover junction endodeoxyribonuclease [Brevibacillus laterosporus]MCZ0851013.1 RusA family crossover junction endodeoxyribonuclease [Brevibacillus laterosporus]
MGTQRLIIPLLMEKRRRNQSTKKMENVWVVPSWNHLYIIVRNKPTLGKWGELYKARVAEAALDWAMDTDWLMVKERKVILRTWIFWNDARNKDCHNTDKAWADALEGIIYEDDSQALIQYQDFQIDRKNPRIEIEPIVGGLIIKDKPKRNNKSSKEQMTMKF